VAYKPISVNYAFFCPKGEGVYAQPFTAPRSGLAKRKKKEIYLRKQRTSNGDCLTDSFVSA